MRETKMQHQETCRMLRREMTRFRLDIGEVQVDFHSGVVTLKGRVRPLRGHENNFQTEIEAVLTSLRHQPHVREVIVEWRA